VIFPGDLYVAEIKIFLSEPVRLVASIFVTYFYEILFQEKYTYQEN
jgi:hypothetical protein